MKLIRIPKWAYPLIRLSSLPLGAIGIMFLIAGLTSLFSIDKKPAANPLLTIGQGVFLIYVGNDFRTYGEEEELDD